MTVIFVFMVIIVNSFQKSIYYTTFIKSFYKYQKRSPENPNNPQYDSLDTSESENDDKLTELEKRKKKKEQELKVDFDVRDPSYNQKKALLEKIVY